MNSPVEAARLVHEFTFSSQISPPLDVGLTPVGARLYFNAGEGVVTGERLKGKFLGGGDWLLVGKDGYGRVDVRGHIQTDDGANLYIYYHGYLEMNEAVGNALQTGVPLAFDEAYFRTSPRIECGDPRYAWVNHSLFVGAGHLLEGGIVEYRVYRVA